MPSVVVAGTTIRYVETESGPMFRLDDFEKPMGYSGIGGLYSQSKKIDEPMVRMGDHTHVSRQWIIKLHRIYQQGTTQRRCAEDYKKRTEFLTEFTKVSIPTPVSPPTAQAPVQTALSLPESKPNWAKDALAKIMALPPSERGQALVALGELVKLVPWPT